ERPAAESRHARAGQRRVGAATSPREHERTTSRQSAAQAGCITMDPAIDPDAIRRKVAWRVLPFIFILYIVSYLDRANVGFAKLAMVDDLKFSEEVFGLGAGIFFIGYLFLEIPGALLVEHWSARKWFARILISWGFVSALTAFVRTPMQFYCARFLLGVA